MEIYSIINTILTFVLGGGWFIYYRANKRKVEGEAKSAEAQANKEAQEYYNKTLADVNQTLNEVRAERDHYKDERNELLQENSEMRKKYIEIAERVAQMDMQYKREISRLERRIDTLSPFLCGVAGCIHRKKVSLMENIDDNSLSIIEGEVKPRPKSKTTKKRL